MISLSSDQLENSLPDSVGAYTLMRIRILPLNLMLIRIRILPLTFSPVWSLQCSKNDPLRLPPCHFDANSDPVFYYDADPDPTFHSNADPDPASQNDGDPDPQHCPVPSVQYRYHCTSTKYCRAHLEAIMLLSPEVVTKIHRHLEIIACNSLQQHQDTGLRDYV